MSKINELFQNKLKIINLGPPIFYKAFQEQNIPAINIKWNPPGGGNEKIINILQSLRKNDSIEKANQEAVKRITSSQPVLVDLAPAKEVIPKMKKDMILHAGPPIKWENMCGPMKGAIQGALIYEGKAKDNEEAEKLLSKGMIEFSPCHHHQAVGPMAGVISPSMYVYCVKNESFGNYAYCTINEGLGKVLRFGANNPEVISRLKWMETVLGPSLRKAIKYSGGINIKNLTAQALLMGDECHNRNVAGTLLFLKEITPYLIEVVKEKKDLLDVINFISGNVHFFLNLSMAACKASTDPIINYPNSTIISTMARNGVEIGIRLSGLGEKWFTAPAGNPKGLYFTGFSEADANLDLGDSTVSEVAGIGAVAMACAPAIVKFTGGTPDDAVRSTRQMYEITAGSHPDYQIANLNFQGTPVGFDLRKIVELGVTPIINTGIAHKEAGIGQIGAGILSAPLEPFHKAILEFGNIVRAGRKL